MTSKSETDKMYEEFIQLIAEAEIYNQKYYSRNRDRMRKYQRRYLKEIKMGIRTTKKKTDKLNNGLKFIHKPVILTFD
tara:strand:+ start:57 stop:290 length:234 start_codon:yes stop_codon:yes gene_type:complete